MEPVICQTYLPSPKGSLWSPHFHQFLIGTSYFLCTVKKINGLSCTSVVICKKKNAVITYTFHTLIF